MKMRWYPVCPIQDMEDRQSHGVVCNNLPLVVLHRQDEWRVFVNRCPHLGIRLEWQPHRFMDEDDLFIQCSTHGALFKPDTGLCIKGPCVNQSLEVVTHKIEDNQIWVSLPER